MGDAATTGSYTANPYTFQSVGHNDIALPANFHLMPSLNLEPNFETEYLME